MAPDPPACDLESAKQLFFEGVACLESGRLEAAEHAFVASLEAAPGRVATLLNLATTRLQRNRLVEALAAADAVLALHAGDVDALGLRALALARLGLHDQALAACDRAIAAEPGRAELWSRRGGLLREMGRLDEARRDFARALRDGDDVELNGYFLAAVAGVTPPPASPARYVEGLFDNYAGRFDEHLVGVLGYRGHVLLTERLLRLPPLATRRCRSALDLGCGTGLCGPLLKPHAERLTGVDLSGRMLVQARDRGTYDRLEQAELVGFLASSEERFDLVVASDVLIYIGDLGPLFAAASRAIDDEGVFGFSIELATEAEAPAGFTLRPSLRYAHSQRYVREQAARNGFTVLDAAAAPIRGDGPRKSAEGMYFCLGTH